jgi:hypothetical protein
MAAAEEMHPTQNLQFHLGWEDSIQYASRMLLEEAQSLMGAEMSPERHFKPANGAAYLSLTVDTTQEAERIFALAV